MAREPSGGEQSLQGLGSSSEEGRVTHRPDAEFGKGSCPTGRGTQGTPCQCADTGSEKGEAAARSHKSRMALCRPLSGQSSSPASEQPLWDLLGTLFQSLPSPLSAPLPALSRSPWKECLSFSPHGLTVKSPSSAWGVPPALRRSTSYPLPLIYAEYTLTTACFPLRRT